ncbi:hypothetical protein BD310DRAFT_698990 [Dichomitus squalens]|uniref:Uncharacterized protein n=1 Tax=Dichomitus squalens TaxID=114155 RepID=A0A4Q9Q6W2_9APHY|nr:hypothetical protein BD310DRAFT_698990 [Dichomitus squalens]
MVTASTLVAHLHWILSVQGHSILPMLSGSSPQRPLYMKRRMFRIAIVMRSKRLASGMQYLDMNVSSLVVVQSGSMLYRVGAVKSPRCLQSSAPMAHTSLPLLYLKANRCNCLGLNNQTRAVLCMVANL